MGRPFSFLCVSVILGMLLGYFLKLTVDGYLLIGLLLLAALSIVFYEKYAWIFICLSFVIVGNYMFSSYMKNDTLFKEYPLNRLALRVEIKGVGVEQGRRAQYDVAILKLIDHGREITINEKARLHINNGRQLPIKLEPFDILTLRNATLIEDFDKEELDSYQLYLRGKGLKSILEVEGKDITKIDKYENVHLINSSYRVRSYIEDFFDKFLPPIEAGMLKSIMFGNQGYLDRETLDLFSISGTAHIIAVSGLHVGVLVLILHYLLNFLNIGKKYTLLLTMVFLLFYSAIVNFPISIIRAITMYYLYVLGYFFQRKYDAINSLMMMAFLLLLFNPLNIFSISFQLSFAATLSILLFFPYMKELLKNLPKYLHSLLAVTIAAQLGTIPIMIYHFNQLSLIAFIANVFIVPALMPLLFIAFISIFFGLFSMHLAATMNMLIHGILAYIHWMVQQLSGISFASIEVEGIGIYLIIIYYFILFAVYLILWHNGMIYRNHRKELKEYEL